MMIYSIGSIGFQDFVLRREFIPPVFLGLQLVDNISGAFTAFIITGANFLKIILNYTHAHIHTSLLLDFFLWRIIAND